MDSFGYYGFLARNLAPSKLARAAGMRLWRQTALPIVPLPTGLSAAGLLQAFGVESAGGLPGCLAAGIEGPLAFCSPASARRSASWIRRHLPAEAEEAVALAERSVHGRIAVFGREVELPRTGAEVPLASPGWIGVDWERDPIVTGERQLLIRGETRAGGSLRRSDPRSVGERIDASAELAPMIGARIPAGRDPKRQWIVGRLEEAVHLACGALLVSPDDPLRAAAYVDAALDRMVDFALAPRGLQWTCTMEVALRAANMAIALRLLAGHQRLEERALALQEILRSLALHLAWIPRHLEDTGVVANNHLVANWVGMLAVAALFPRLPGAHLAARRASKGVSDELMAQTLPDGFGFEGSVPYHRLAVELFLLGDLFATTAGLPLPEPVRQRLARAFAATDELVDGRGLAPRIGDDDSGRAIPFSRRDPLDLSWLASLGAALFGRSEGEVSPPSPEQIWLLGSPPAPSGQRHRGRGRHVDSALHHGGIYLLRSRRLSVSIACGPNGTGGLGTHGHNDKLSVEVCVDGILVVGDPGSGSYSGDPALRNHLRGTAAHSTVQVDGAEQQPMPIGRLFALPEQADARCLGFESSPERSRFVGEHKGYLRLGVSHRRVVALDRVEETIEIVDRISADGGLVPAIRKGILQGTRPRGGAPSSGGLLRLAARGIHRAQCRFLIPGDAGQPRVQERGEGSWVVEVGPPGRVVAKLIPEPGTPRPLLEPAWYARGYDQVEAATAVVFEKEGALPLVFRTTIRPSDPGDVHR